MRLQVETNDRIASLVGDHPDRFQGLRHARDDLAPECGRDGA